MSNQYDEIKELLKNSRRMTGELLKEEEGRELTPEEQKREEEDFRRAVSDRVKFGKIKIYESGGLPKVEWMGELIRERMEFVFSLDDTVGCYVSADLLQLRDDTLKTLEKLRAYYDGWAKKWSEETSTEFEEMEETGEEETEFDSMGVGSDIGDFDDEIEDDVEL
tara:strand:+ start:816 stop:1310 length:495 start_codon:yes stop_codon:yes gene_type:complete